MRRLDFDDSRLLARSPYNAGIRVGSDRTLMVYRDGGNYASDIFFVELDKSLSPRRWTTTSLGRPWSEFSSYEDPRMFGDDGLSFIAWSPDRTVQCYRWHGVTKKCESPVKSPVEKNWIFFEDKGALRATYSLRNDEHVVIDTATRAEWRTTFSCDWRWGEMRGGTNYVDVDEDLMISLFHSRRDWVDSAKRTRMQFWAGAIVVERKAPYRVVGVSREPLRFVPEWVSSGRWKYFVVFPCGLARAGNSLVASCGWNDSSVRLYEFKIKELLDACGLQG